MATAEVNDSQVPDTTRAKLRLCVLSREENQPCEKVIGKTCTQGPEKRALSEERKGVSPF